MRICAQKFLRAACGQMPARDVSVPAGFGQPVLKARHDALRVGKPLFRGKRLMQARAREIAAQLLGMRLFPPRRNLKHDARDDVGLARRASLNGDAEILVHGGKVELILALPEAGTHGAQAGVRVDAPIAGVNAHEEQLEARRCETGVVGHVGLIAHVGDGRNAPALDLDDEAVARANDFAFDHAVRLLFCGSAAAVDMSLL